MCKWCCSRGVKPDRNGRCWHTKRRSMEQNARQTGNYKLTRVAMAARWELYDRCCYVCGQDLRSVIKGEKANDHVKPISAGGKNYACNFRPICRWCNDDKNGKSWRLYVRSFSGRLPLP